MTDKTSKEVRKARETSSHVRTKGKDFIMGRSRKREGGKMGDEWQL
jgi:hypothetical protein